MNYVTVDIDQKQRVATMWLDYKRENRLSLDLIEEVLQALDSIEEDRNIRAVVVTGRDPKFFSNGLDLEFIMANIANPQTVIDYLGRVNFVFRRFTLFPKPVVAAINGHAFGGGLLLAAHMDFRFMREDRGWICLPEMDIHVPLLPGMIAILRATLTPQTIHRMYYTGKRFTGLEAVQIGFVEAALSGEGLLAHAVAFAAELGKKRTKTYAEFKRRLRADVVRVLDEEDPAQFENTLRFVVS